MINEELYQQWLSTRPPEIQELGRKYPPGTMFLIHGEVMHVTGFREYETGLPGVMISRVDPEIDYEKAIATSENICGCCVDNLDSLKL